MMSDRDQAGNDAASETSGPNSGSLPIESLEIQDLPSAAMTTKQDVPPQTGVTESMTSRPFIRRLTTLLLTTAALAGPGTAMAYDTKDAIRACESRLRSEYGLRDLRDAHAVQIPGDKHYRVQGKTEVDDRQYPWHCEVDDRKVVDLRYRGPRPQRPGDDSVRVRRLASGDIEVRVPVGCRAIYDDRGDLVRRDRDCGPREMRHADDTIADYLRAHRRERELPPQILPGRHGGTEVVFEDRCVVHYDHSDRRTGAHPSCRDGQILEADRAMRNDRRGHRY
ncbi:hypothetical protein [Imhoffiella purpurea]|uniref:Uncharacterized protein n=1 Tax=Imhoffiella purpurea TaxID=1249627 RepID=W9V4W0_9GAMM|nr:hypothetical protein [Imhoffiella purpurea]EXJ14583.1 hypothetical protein D779_2375 [Imhoffiella purpurea]